MTYITMGGLDHFQVSAFSWTTQYTIIVSWDLLSWISEEAWGGIPFSFTNFITVQEFSGPLYISPDIYHTQITEYTGDNLSNWQSLSVSSFFSASIIFLIVILLDPPPFTFTMAFSFPTGVLENIFPVLFPLQ